MDIPRKNGIRNHGRNSKKIPEWERNKRRVLVEELKTVGPCKAFKLGFPLEHLQLTENSEFLPQGAIIRPFLFSYRARRQHRGDTIGTDM
jgi:hypothetical protein